MAKVCKKTLVRGTDGRVYGIEFDFTNGHTHKVAFTDFTSEVREMAEAMGFSQTLGDAYSQSGGNPDMAETMFLSRLGVIGGPQGTWNKGTREGGGQADEDLIQALAEVTGKPMVEARQAVKDGDKAWKDARRKHPAVAAVIARLVADRKADRAESADVSTDDLL